jgi:hypothetical protein
VVLVPGGGRLIVDWTINESTDPNNCSLGGAAAIDIVVTTVNGGFAGEFQAPCASFATTISSLAPGTYVATAELIGGAGEARTTAVPIGPFTIAGNDVSTPIDFPASSFF